ncbi:hypothetical protein [Roseobacter sp. HKCCA0434]|uniref:OmpP1/FadL family transporter n=1 Tax=Roseobacter sp. HKCCA0434 TaxID=3079297 RepID=UPI0029058503|nr:hypothetical protein [Roseobacter sp. HKCCA0434]
MTKMAKLLTATAAAALATTGAMAGGIDRTGSDVGLIYEESGRYLQFSGAFVFPEVDGTLQLPAVAGGPADTGNSQDDYTIFGAGYRADFNENISYAVIYDQPFGADVDYGTGPFAGTEGEINTDSLTGVVRYEFGNGFGVHGGLRALRSDANTAVPAALYTLDVDSDTGYGYLVGMTYERPEIALRVALTYNSEIELDFDGTERGAPTSFSTDLPDSVNLEVQSGVAPGTLVFGSIRWADYSEFTVAPPGYGAAPGGPLISYEDDVWAYTLGVGRAITENFSVAVTLGYEGSSDSASPSLFSPADGSRSISIGGAYDFGTVELSGGIRYTDLGDETIGVPVAALGGAIVPAQFENNSAISIGLSLGFKL